MALGLQLQKGRMAQDCLTGTELHVGKCHRACHDRAVSTFNHVVNLTPAPVSHTSLTADPCPQTNMSFQTNLPIQNMCEPGNTLQGKPFCFMLAQHEYDSISSTNKTSRPNSNNHFSLQKPFPKAGKPQRSSSLYTTLQ